MTSFVLTTTDPSTVRTDPRRWALPVLGGMLVLRTALLFAGDGVIWALARATGVRPESAMIYADVAIVAVDLITLALVARLAGGLRRVIGPVRRRDVAIAVPVTLAIAFWFVVATFVGNLVVYAGPPPAATTDLVPPLWLGIWSITIMPITVAVAEETLYRGFALDQIRRRWGTVAAVVITSVFFGLQHAALSTASLEAALARVITTFLIGLLFAVFAVRLRRLAPLIMAHWVIDVLGLGLPLLLAAIR